MDDADPPAGAGDDTPGVLGNLPTTRPQHRSARRGSTAAPAGKTASRTTTAAKPRAAAKPRTAAKAKPVTEAPLPTTVVDDAKPAPSRPTLATTPAPAPEAPAPPSAPRSGWATPESAPAPAELPPLVALADGAVRVGAQVVRGVLRRLPGR